MALALALRFAGATRCNAFAYRNPWRIGMQEKIMLAMARRIKARPSGKEGSWVAEDSASCIAALRADLAALTEAEAFEALTHEPFILNASQAAQWLAKNEFINRPKRSEKKGDKSAVALMAKALAEAS